MSFDLVETIQMVRRLPVGRQGHLPFTKAMAKLEVAGQELGVEWSVVYQYSILYS